MQNPLASLRSEHALIRVALQVLRAMVVHIRSGGAFPSHDVKVLLRFLQEFYLAVHCRKEADVVFPALVMLGSDQLAESVGDLTREQADVTALVQMLHFLWEPEAELTDDERVAFADTALALCDGAERLMQLEEDHAFPAAELGVPVDDRLGWCAQFAAIDRGHPDLAAWSASIRRLRGDWLS